MKVQPTRRKNVFWIIRMTVYYLKIYGLAPFSFRTSTSTVNSRKTCIINFRFSKIGLVYNLLLSIVFITLATLILGYRFNDNFRPHNTMSHMIYVMRVITCGFATCIIIISWTFKQKSAVSIINRLFEVEVETSRLQKQPSNRRTIIFVTSHLIFAILLWIMFGISQITVNPSNDHILRYWRVITAHLIFWYTIEYAIAVSLIVRGLGIVNENLLKLKDAGSSVSCSPFVDDFLQAFSSQTQIYKLATLRSLIRIRTKLSDVAEDVENFFSFPILCCVVATFAAVVRDTHKFIIFPSGLLLPLSGFLTFLCINLYPVVLLAANVTETAKQAKLTSLIVRKAITLEVDPEIKALLGQFSLHLLHDDFTFTAYGFFTLDLTLLSSIVGATMSYLIVSLQFETSC